MTQHEAHKLVAKECRRRGRKYGDQNERNLRQMRAEVAFLKLSPMRWATVFKYAMGGRRGIGDGAFVTGRRASNWEAN